mmetsp:Transcript_14512/g.27881  ORF Transcript_14512/g.27881 Transcript_14512/m.27881 type:complete len:268 (+) Transcript_14512:107-910(+)
MNTFSVLNKNLVCVTKRGNLRAETKRRVSPPAFPIVHADSRETNEKGLALVPPTRRQAILGVSVGIGLATVLPSSSVLAFSPPPPGLRLQKDRLDGYQFFYPEDWIPVRSAAADIFFRDISDVETNLFMEFSSPSSSSYSSVEDLGTPEKAAQRILDQYLVEFMSTRIGVRRTANVVAATRRESADGTVFYDIDINLKSYADSNQFGITPEERVEQLEFNRRLFTTLGVKNKQLYELRLQTPESKVKTFEATVRQIQQSLKLFDKLE